METVSLESSSPARHARTSPRPISVLIVDDDIDTHSLLAVVLQHAGYTVECVSNGKEALEMLTRVKPSVILLDIEMPLMTGPEFRQHQRRDPGLLSIPTIVMTGSHEEAVLDPAIEMVLRKPFSTKALLTAIAVYCPLSA